MIIEQLLNQGNIRDARIVLVDDHEDGVALLTQILRKAGYTHVSSTTDSRETVRMCEELDADLLILDLNMPPPSGYDILDQLALRPGKANGLPILVLTADITPIAKLKALSLGARDFLTKPIEQVDLLLRVRNMLETRLAFLQLERTRAEESHAHCLHNGDEMTDRLFATLKCWDPQMADRAARVGRTVALLAKAAGVAPKEIDQMESAARVCDLGMISIPESIRSNPFLNLEEKKLFKTHVTVAERILGQTEGGSAAMKLALEIATSHHERWDGGGYPQGLSGSAIPLGARITAVALALDLLLHPVNGKQGLAMEDAVPEVSRESGFAFDPSITQALERTMLPVGVLS